MNLLLFLYLMLLFDSAPGSLPAPVNVYVKSVNFLHVLTWDPGPGTPAGTQYKIFRRVNKTKRQLQNQANTTTSLKLKLKNETKYHFKVQAVYNQMLSPVSRQTTFTPYIDTQIDPPKVLLVGCGNCIQVTIALPKADKSSNISDIQVYYGAVFEIWWNKSGGAVETLNTSDKSFTLKHLETGTEYCVRVLMTLMRKNTEPSEWTCTHTSPVEPNKVPIFVGTAAGLMIFLGSLLMTFLFILAHTGFLCKLKAALPRALLSLMEGDVLTLESPSFDVVSISSEQNGKRKRHNPTVSQQPAGGANSGDEDGDEEEEDEEKVYVDRNADLSSGDVSGCCKLAAPGDSGNLSAQLSVDAEADDVEIEVGVVREGLDEDEAKDEGGEIVSMPDEDQTTMNGHIQGEEEEEREIKKEESGNLGNINLFSVTLGLLARDKEEEEEEGEQSTRDSLTDFLKLLNEESLPPTDSRWTLSHTESGVDVQKPLLLLQPAQDSGYERRRADSSDAFETCADEEEEEESGYMGRS